MTVYTLPRAVWDNSGRPRLGTPLAPDELDGMIVHHTVIVHEPAPELGDEIAYMRRLRTSRPDLGEDVPYNFVVFRSDNPLDCVVAEGRGLRSGAHTAGTAPNGVKYNACRLGVAFAGDSRIPGVITPGVVAGFNMLGRTYLPHATQPTIGHGQIPGAATDCPSQGLRDVLAQLQPPFTGGTMSQLLTDPNVQEILDAVRRRPERGSDRYLYDMVERGVAVADANAGGIGIVSAQISELVPKLDTIARRIAELEIGSGGPTPPPEALARGLVAAVGFPDAVRLLLAALAEQ